MADTNGEEGYLWDAKTVQVLWPDGTPTRSTAAMAAAAEKLRDEEAVQVAVDFCAGTQSVGPVYRSKRNVMYIPLDAKGEVYSGARQKKVKNIPYDIMKSSPVETMGIVVTEMQRRKRGAVRRIRLGEVWLSPPCNTFCKLGPINKEHQFRGAKTPLRKPIKGTKKGEQAEEADALVQRALQLVEFRASKKAEQLWTGKMMVVEGVEIDLRAMEWFM